MFQGIERLEFWAPTNIPKADSAERLLSVDSCRCHRAPIGQAETYRQVVESGRSTLLSTQIGSSVFKAGLASIVVSRLALRSLLVVEAR